MLTISIREGADFDARTNQILAAIGDGRLTAAQLAIKLRRDAKWAPTPVTLATRYLVHMRRRGMIDHTAPIRGGSTKQSRHWHKAAAADAAAASAAASTAQGTANTALAGANAAFKPPSLNSADVPPCATPAQFHAWARLAAYAPPGVTGFCEDCTPAYAEKMRAALRCARPGHVFTIQSKGAK